MFRLATLLLGVAGASGVNAYSFYFSTQPTQCKPLTVNIVGQGKPPYRLLLADGHSVYEAGRWTDVTFSGSSFTIDALQWTGDRQFVAMLSDQDGVGTGGTSALTPVFNSSDSSCNPSFINGGADFHWDFDSGHSSSLPACKPTNVSIWSNLAFVKPPLSGFVMLLSGQSFALDLPPSFKNLEHAWFEWTVNLPANSDFVMGLGDANGDLKGTMHYPHHVADSGDTSCYGASSPKITSNPAGQVSLDGSIPEPPQSTGTTDAPASGQSTTPPSTASSTPGTIGSPDNAITGQTSQRPYYYPGYSTPKTDNSTVGIVAGVLGTIIVLLLLGIGAFVYWWRTSYIKRARRNQDPASLRYSVQTASTAPPASVSPFVAHESVPVPYVLPPAANGQPLTQKERQAVAAARPEAPPSEGAGSRAESSQHAAASPAQVDPVAHILEDRDVRRDTVPPPYGGTQ